MNFILTKIYALLLTITYFFTPYVAPALTDPIVVSDPDNAKLTFVAAADPQISNYMLKRDQFLRAMGEDIGNAQCDIDALLFAGDIAENGLKCEYDRVTELLKDTGVKNYIISVGNHDVRLRLYKKTVKTFTSFVNGLNENAGSQLKIDKLNYTYNINGYNFIVLGTDRTEFEESYLSEAQLQWLDDSLNEFSEAGKPVFVVIHQTFKDVHGLPDTWNSPFDWAGSVGDQSNALYDVMNKYQNVILLTGHLHTGFGQYTYEKLGNIHSVNLPSATINNKDGVYNENGIGFFVEVYDNEVLFRARNFNKGEFVKDCDFSIPLV
ncbi:MAG: metallophosphoesterase [Clostridia bacterium]|nr:metallophosphoesterase [Clostridia bacterium]